MPDRAPPAEVDAVDAALEREHQTRVDRVVRHSGLATLIPSPGCLALRLPTSGTDHGGPRGVNRLRHILAPRMRNA